jgi:O-antigen ligase
VTLPAALVLPRSRNGEGRGWRIPFAAGIVVIAITVGVVLPSSSDIPPAVWILAGPALLAFGFLVMQGPQWCLAGLIASVVFGLTKTSVALGSVDVRVPDLFLVALAGWVVVLRARYGQRGWIPGRRLLALWLAALGLSLYPLLVRGTVGADSIVGWLRLAATFALVWFVPYALYRVRDIEFVLGAIALSTTAEILEAVIRALASGNVGSRLTGANSANATGLLAAIVIVLALHGPVPRRPSLRLVMIGTGVVGLLMSRSLGSTTAAVVALGVYGLHAVGTKRSLRRGQELVVPTRLLVMLLVGLAIAMALRPQNLPTSSSFGGSTTAHRAVLAYAGFEMFKQDPLFGIGWQRSHEEISSPAVSSAVQERFGTSVNPAFIPGVDKTPEVHNSYVQVLAESGLVGFLLLLALLVTMGRGIARVLRSVRSNHRLYVGTRAAVVLLVVVLIWWNDNALFGAQPESVLAATFLGILAAVPAIAAATRRNEAIEVAA